MTTTNEFRLHHNGPCQLCAGIAGHDGEFDYCRACGFTTLATESLKAKSDAEVIVEWLKVPSRKIEHHVEGAREYSASYATLNESYTITCPTLSELAAKLRSMK